MKKFTTLALAAAMTAALGCTAFADGTVNGTITYDVTANGGFSADDEWGQAWIQAWGGTLTVNSAYVTLDDGTKVDVTFDDKYVITMIGTDDDGNNIGAVEDATKVASITYVVSYDADEYNTEDTWIGGGIGLNSDSTGWKSIEWGKASGEKAIAIEDTVVADAPAEDEKPADNTGDVAPVAYLAAVVALAGVAMVASKKARA